MRLQGYGICNCTNKMVCPCTIYYSCRHQALNIGLKCIFSHSYQILSIYTYQASYYFVDKYMFNSKNVIKIHNPLSQTSRRADIMDIADLTKTNIITFR